MAALPGVVRGCMRNLNRPHKIYFFAGDRYWRYDLRRGYGEVHYPLSMDEWKFGAPYASGIDAAVERKGSNVAYFFKGDSYLTYDWETESVLVAPRPLAEWHHAVAGFEADVDLALNGEGA